MRYVTTNEDKEDVWDLFGRSMLKDFPQIEAKDSKLGKQAQLTKARNKSDFFKQNGVPL